MSLWEKIGVLPVWGKQKTAGEGATSVGNGDPQKSCESPNLTPQSTSEKVCHGDESVFAVDPNSIRNKPEEQSICTDQSSVETKTTFFTTAPAPEGTADDSRSVHDVRASRVTNEECLGVSNKEKSTQEIIQTPNDAILRASETTSKSKKLLRRSPSKKNRIFKQKLTIDDSSHESLASQARQQNPLPGNETLKSKKRRRNTGAAVSYLETSSKDSASSASSGNDDDEVDLSAEDEEAYLTPDDGSLKEGAMFTVDLRGLKRALKHATVPMQGTLEHKMTKHWAKLRQQATEEEEFDNTTRTLPVASELFPPAVEQTLQVLYHVIKVHLVKGEMREALEVFHKILQSIYETVEDILLDVLKDPTENNIAGEDALIRLREKAAGVWCLYAHFFIQVTETDAFLRIHEVHIRSSVEDQLWDHAIATLTEVASCPLAGNHAAITLALSRLKVRQRQRGRLKSFPAVGDVANTAQFPFTSNAAHWRQNLEVALQICRDGLERSSSTDSDSSCLSSRQVTYFEKYGLLGELRLSLTIKRVATVFSTLMARDANIDCSTDGTEAGIKERDTAALVSRPYLASVFSLPSHLKRTLRGHGYGLQLRQTTQVPCLFFDKAGAALICIEMNRLSRLEQSVETYHDDTLLHLVCTPKCVHDKSSADSDDGIVWQEILFFQTMDVVLLREEELLRYEKVLKQPAATSWFFSNKASNAIWKDIDDMHSEVAFSDLHVYSDVKYACTKCAARDFDTLSELKDHREKCGDEESPDNPRRPTFGNDSLSDPWVTVSYNSTNLALNKGLARDLDSPCSVNERGSSGTFIVVNYACRKCRSSRFLSEAHRDKHEAVCGRPELELEVDAGAQEENKVLKKVECYGSSSTSGMETSSQKMIEVAKKRKRKIWTEDAATYAGKAESRRVKQRRDSEVEIPDEVETDPPCCGESLYHSCHSDSSGSLSGKAPHDAQQSTVKIIKPLGGKAAYIAPEYACRKCFRPGFLIKSERNGHERVCEGLERSNTPITLQMKWPKLKSKALDGDVEVPKNGKPIAEYPCLSILEKMEEIIARKKLLTRGGIHEDGDRSQEGNVGVKFYDTHSPSLSEQKETGDNGEGGQECARMSTVAPSPFLLANKTIFEGQKSVTSSRGLLSFRTCKIDKEEADMPTDDEGETEAGSGMSSKTNHDAKEVLSCS